MSGARAFAGGAPIQVLTISDQGNFLGGANGDLGVSYFGAPMDKSELPDCFVNLNLYEVERKVDQVAVVGDGQIRLGKSTAPFRGSGILNSVTVDGIKVLIGYLFGSLDSGTRVNVGIHWIPERNQYFLTVVVGTLGDEPPIRIHVGTLVKEMSDAVYRIIAAHSLRSEETELSTGIGTCTEPQPWPVEFMGSSTRQFYYDGTYYKMVTLAAWSNSTTNLGRCYTSARVWSHSADVVDYFNVTHPTTWGDDAVAELATVSEAVCTINFGGTQYDWHMESLEPEASQTTYSLISFSLSVKLSPPGLVVRSEG